ncbi:hypothetical protein HR45_02460 [Shewanella mangrovi]|uniref:DUF4136 domain-containing protein n=1 Tax=Shewanella mangrovi TaxID=1515746 RepID=A0A094JH23_9GAMM|nr:DUF4136 domain-containing protein [Shewanella mangrovi]KFZ39270.1 hypothetical protein HR45_02460 [Shewanella mangrovi]
MKYLMLAAVALVMAGCASVHPGWDYDPATNFSQYKTYAWVETKATDGEYQKDGLLAQRVHVAVDQQLAAKGFVKVDAKDAELMVNYMTKVNKRADVDTLNANFGWGPYWYRGWWGGPSYSQVKEYDVGDLILDMVDAKNHQLIWRSTAKNIVRDYKTPQQRIDKVNEAAAAMLGNFPPKAD